METTPYVWLKPKYAQPKTKGKYPGGARPDRKGPKKGHKIAAMKGMHRKMVMVLDLAHGGKIRWVEA